MNNVEVVTGNVGLKIQSMKCNYMTEVVLSYGGHPALLVVDVQNDKQNAIVGGISMKVK